MNTASLVEDIVFPWEEVEAPPPVPEAPKPDNREAAPAVVKEAVAGTTKKKISNARLLERAMCVSVNIARPGNSRKVPSGQVSIDADLNRISVSKQLIDSETLRKIYGLDSDIRQWLYRRCLPFDLLKSGIYLIPIPMVDEAEKVMTDFAAQRKVLVEKFLGEYEVLKEEAKNCLRSTYKDSDYPPTERLRSLFSFEWDYVNFGTPEALGSVSKALYDREKAKAEVKMVEAAETVQQALRVAMAGMVDKMVEALSTKEDGKKKVFRDARIERMKEFLDMFRDRNLTDDAEMEVLVEKAKGILSGVDPKMLRSDDSIRDSVRVRFEEIQTQLSSMVTDAPIRQFDFELTAPE